MTSIPLLAFTNRGIYCQEADVYLDPWKPVKKAFISHGHSDHSRVGNKTYITHNYNVPIIRHRLGKINVKGVDWNKSFKVNGVKFTLFPAGHVVGSSIIVVEYRGEKWVYTGDYKLENDGLTTPAEIIKCHSLITECTFGLPVFNWKPQSEVIHEIVNWHTNNKKHGINSILFCYSLGKAQRLIHALSDYIEKIFTHGAIENMNEVVRNIVPIPSTTRIIPDNNSSSKMVGEFIIAPPSAHGTTWIKRFTPYATAVASGWMALRGHRRRRAVDKGFVVSDHIDWNGLMTYIKQSGAERVVCTHGYTGQVSNYLNEMGISSYTESTKFEIESD